MTETLQNKIDAIFKDLFINGGEHYSYQNINKAIQELREEIEQLPTHRYKSSSDYFIGISKWRVLSLIGEKK